MINDKISKVRHATVSGQQEAEMIADLGYLIYQIFDADELPGRDLVRRFLDMLEPAPADDRRRVRILSEKSPLGHLTGDGR